jgi:hypothetical protein
MPDKVDKTNIFQGGKRPAEFAHRLFYQARNLAIEAMLLRLDNSLLRKGFNVQSEWQESSFGAPTVEIRMYNPKAGAWKYGTSKLHLKRERIDAPNDASALYYSLESVQSTEYWPRKQPQQLLDFRAAIDVLEAEGYFQHEIEKLNYPFDAGSHSIF